MPDMAVFFGEGADARLAGLPPAANPHIKDTPEGKYWRYGWNHVQDEWASLVRGRWWHRPLPPVRVGEVQAAGKG